MRVFEVRQMDEIPKREGRKAGEEEALTLTSLSQNSFSSISADFTTTSRSR